MDVAQIAGDVLRVSTRKLGTQTTCKTFLASGTPSIRDRAVAALCCTKAEKIAFDLFGTLLSACCQRLPTCLCK
jgi:hypothetical protein